mmetsp:Transcript_32705/g.65107  ORF Transcript_32705/g.65107 Transcript_32705/m.65107 type:complete len:205 (-) Transcript_32705:71-685(-)
MRPIETRECRPVVHHVRTAGEYTELLSVRAGGRATSKLHPLSNHRLHVRRLLPRFRLVRVDHPTVLRRAASAGLYLDPSAVEAKLVPFAKPPAVTAPPQHQVCVCLLVERRPRVDLLAGGEEGAQLVRVHAIGHLAFRNQPDAHRQRHAALLSLILLWRIFSLLFRLLRIQLNQLRLRFGCHAQPLRDRQAHRHADRTLLLRRR